MTKACVDCKYFKPDKDFQKFSWFGLRKDVNTRRSLTYGLCGKTLLFAANERMSFGRCRAEAKLWEPKHEG